MKRFRLVFAIVTVALAMPLALLVLWSVRSVAEEDRFRTHALASRIFDEMEAELTQVLDEESGLPAGAARSDTSRMRRLTGSSSYRADSHSFVVGYFEANHAGNVVAVPRQRGSTTSTEEQAKIEALAESVWQAPEPDVTQALAGQTQQQADPESVYAQFDKLNRSGEKRSARLKKTVRARSKEMDNLDQRAEQPRIPAPTQSQLDAEPRARAQRSLGSDALGELTSRRADSDHLLIFRTVTVAGGAQHAGLIIDVPKLVEHFTREIIAPSDLGSYATLRPLAASAPHRDATAPGGGEFIHRFAEPYGQLVLSLTLAGLPKSDSAAYVYSLGAMLALVAALGLLAVYRMVSTTVAFAERRSNFVSAVTHELKTPLTAIRMYSEMLQEDLVADQPTRERYYRTITAETERLTRLVNNVLELSNLDRNQRPMSLVVGDVGPVLREVESIVRPHAAEQEFELLLETADELPAVQFERDALVQVLVNLVDNAIKYASTARDKRIHLVANASPDRGVVLAVADHGPGVEDTHLRHIFEPFYRGQQELTRTAKGTGIGLSLVRSLVQRMNGSVGGRNTTPGFVVEIRLRAPQS